LLAAAGKQLKANAALLGKLLKKKSDQVAAINKVESLALSASPFSGRTGRGFIDYSTDVESPPSPPSPPPPPPPPPPRVCMHLHNQG
jgi:hypothetical protein